MILKLYSAPAIEPVSLQDMKNHLRLDSGSVNDNLSPVQSIVPGSHGIDLELMTLDVAPATTWEVGDTITGQTSAKTCTVVTVITTKTYIVSGRNGAFTLGEVVGVTGVAGKLADQGATKPTFAGSGYYLLGASADVLGLQAVVVLDSGTNQATGTNDVKIQESDDNSTWTDWTGGAFTQVTTANDNAIQKIAYTGSKQYIRVVAKTLLAACSFGVLIVKYASDSTEDDLLTALITTARQQAEVITQRKFITQTWDKYLDAFPDKDFIEIPFGNLQSVTSIKYTDSDGTETTMTVTTDYLVDDDSDPGRIVLPYEESWPSATLHPVNPIAIRFVCGYGDNASDVPAGIRTAIKMMVEGMYNNRSDVNTQQQGNVAENKAVMNLLWPFRLWNFG